LQGPMNQEQVDTFHERLAARHTGEGNANRPIIVDRSQGADIKNLGFSTREMEFIAGIQLTKEHVADALAVPEELMAGSAHSTFSNRAEARREFYTNTITQEWDFLASNRQENFIPMLPAKYANLVLAFDTTGIEALSENLNEVSDRTRAELAAGAITLNEFRRANGYDERPEYDVLFVPTDINPVLAGEAIEPVQPALAAPSEEGRSTPDFLAVLGESSSKRR
jgi:phage portal protein BeeE